MSVIRRAPADHRRMRWANGKGETVELWRQDGPDGMLWRLSMATVAEDGPFSIFPDVERNLTVIDGPGFALQGEGLWLDCKPMVPVAFAGDVPVAAVRTGGAVSVDFNVMTARRLTKPDVFMVQSGTIPAHDALLALFALEPTVTDGGSLETHALLVTDGNVTILSGRVLSVRLFGVDLPDA